MYYRLMDYWEANTLLVECTGGAFIVTLLLLLYLMIVRRGGGEKIRRLFSNPVRVERSPVLDDGGVPLLNRRQIVSLWGGIAAACFIIYRAWNNPSGYRFSLMGDAGGPLTMTVLITAALLITFHRKQ